VKPRVIRSRAGISGEVRILLVGFGFMGKMHAAVYRQLKGVSLAGVVDPRIQETKKHLRSMQMDAPVFRDLEFWIPSSANTELVNSMHNGSLPLGVSCTIELPPLRALIVKNIGPAM